MKHKKQKAKSSPFLRATRWVLHRALLAVRIVVCLALLVPIPLFLVWFSYTVDRNGWFQGEQTEREIAIGLLEGNSIGGYEKMDERQIVKLYAQNLPESRKVIAIGSSRILQMTTATSGSDSFFNAGMIGAEQTDVMSSYYLFDRAGRLPEMVIFGVDPWIFSSGTDANRGNRTDWEMYNEFLRYGLAHVMEPLDNTENITQWVSLTNPSFFRENLEYAAQNGYADPYPTVPAEELYTQKMDVKLPDGSVLYAVGTRERPQEDVDATAAAAIDASFLNCEDFYELDEEKCRLFDEFIRYMQRKGSRVILVLTPYHPLVYNQVMKQPDRYSGFLAVEPWLREYAAKHGLALYGSYDPDAAGSTSADFFDGWHVRDEGIRKFFPGVNECVAYTPPEDTAQLPRQMQPKQNHTAAKR